MFENLVKNNYNVKYFEKSNFYAFEISNFLSDIQYNAILSNLPNIKKDEGLNYNSDFHNKDSQHQSKAFVTEVDMDNYNRIITENLILREFVHELKSQKFINFFMKKFFFQTLKSRIYDKKNLLKLLIRKNRSVNKKSDFLFDKLLYNDLITTVGLAYLYNGAESYPHTDGMKKVMSLMLYFPDDNLSSETNKNLGTTFYNSSVCNLKQIGKTHVNTHQDSENFKKNNNKSMTLPFNKKNLYGFIKSHKSWHSVEPFNIHKDFVRKSININILLV